jgi:hypothetical protein
MKMPPLVPMTLMLPLQQPATALLLLPPAS